MSNTVQHSSYEAPGKGVLGLVMGLVLLLIACGKLQEKLAEKATEQAVEHATGKKVDLQDGRVQVKDDKGNTAEWGAGTKLPDGWPASLSPYPGSELVASYAARNNGKLSGTLSMKTSDTADKVLAHYTKALADFRLKSEMNMNGTQTKIFEKDGRTVTVNIVPNDNQTQANLVVANF